MATYYWVGGSGNWDSNSTANWASSSGGTPNAGVPTYLDDVVFDANSNTGTDPFTVTVTGTTTLPAVCNDFTTSSLDGVMTLDFGTTGTLDIYGSATFPATNFSIAAAATTTNIRFQANSSGKTFTTNGVSLGNVPVAFAGVGGEWTLGSAFTSATTIFIRAGIFNTGNYSVSAARIRTNNLPQGARTVNLGSSTVTLTSFGDPFIVDSDPNLTWNSGTSTINLTGNGVAFSGGSYVFNNVTFSGVGAGSGSITGANTFNNLTINAPTTGTTTVTFAADQVINGTFTSAGTSGLAEVRLSSSVAGIQRTITAAAISISFTELQDIVAAGASAPWTLAGGNGNLGNNGNITFNTSVLYWIGGTGSWSDGTKWSTSSGGSAANYSPTVQNSVVFDNNSNVGTGAFTVTVDGTTSAPSVCNDFSTSSLDGVMTLSMGATAFLDSYGSMTLPATNLTWTGTAGSRLTFRSSATGKTITTNGVSLSSTAIVFDGTGGEWTLGSALTTVVGISVNNGSLVTSNFNVSTSALGSSTATTRSIALGSSTVTLTGAAPFSFTSIVGLTWNAGTSTLTMSNASPTFAGGGLTFNNVSFTSAAAGTTTISGVNTFNNLTQTSRSATGFRLVTLVNDQTVSGTLTLGVANTAIRRIQVQSSVIGTQRTITLNGTLATLNDVDIKDIATAGSAGTWTGTRIGDGTNNSGITFDAPKTVYWNLAAGGSWSATGWATGSGVAPAANNFPLAQDTAIIENTGLNTSATITIDQNWWFGNIDCSTRSNAYTLAWGAIDPVIFGNFTLSSAATITSTTTPSLNFNHNSGTRTINTAGVSFPVAVQLFCFAGTVQLIGNLNTSGIANAFNLTNGTLDLNNNTLTCTLFTSNNANTRAIAFGSSGNITVTGNNASIWSTTNATNLTITGNPVVNCTYSGSVGTRTIAASTTGATAASAISFNITAGTDAVNISNASAYYKDINFTGFSGTFTQTNSIFVTGNYTLSTGMSVVSSANTLNLVATSGTQFITSNGKTIGPTVQINCPGATVQFQDAFTMDPSRALFLTAGTLNANNQNVSIGNFSSNNSNTRTLTMGSGTWTFTGSFTVWDLATTTGLTFNRGTANINVPGSATASRTFNGGGLTYNSLTFTDCLSVNLLGVGNTFTNLTVGVSSVEEVTGFIPESFTVTGTLTLGSATSISRRLRVRSTSGTSATITAAAVSLNNVDFLGITAAGASSPWSGANLGNGGGNVNINFAAPKTVYWSLPAGGTWSDTAWATSSGGTPSAANFPLAQDTAIVDDTGLNLNGTITVLSNFVIPNLSFATRTLAMTYNPQNTSIFYCGDLTFSSAVNFVTQTVSNFVGGGTQNITSAGKTFFGSINIFNYGTGTVRLVDNLTCSNTSGITLTVGNLDLNNNTITAFLFNSSNTNTRSIAFGTGNITLYGNGVTVWTTSTATNFTVTGTPVVNATYSGSAGTRAFIVGDAGVVNLINLNISAGTDTVSVGLTLASIKDLNFTGFNGTLSTSTRRLFGNLTLSAGMTVAGGTLVTTFAGTSGTQQITTNGVVLDIPLTVDGIGGTVQLQGNLTMGSTRTFTLTAGTLDLVDKTLTAGLFNSNNSNVRTLAFGTGNITVTGNNATVFTTSSAVNLTTSGNRLVQATYAGSTGTRTFAFGATSEADGISLNVTAGTDSVIAGTSVGVIKNLNFTGFSGTLNNGTRNIYGNLIISNGMTLTAGASVTTFAGTSGTQQITTNGKTLDFPITFNGVGGTFAFQDALTQGSTRTLTLTSGTLTTNNYNVTTGIFNSNNANVRTLNMGSSTFTTTAATFSTVWNIADSTNLTLNAGTSTVDITHGGASIRQTFQGGNQTYYNLIDSNTATNAGLSILGDNTFNNLTFATPSSPGRNLNTIAGNQIVNGLFTISGANGNQRSLLAASPLGAGARSITAASVSTLTDVDFRGITALGAAIPWSGTRLGNCGGNTNINFGAGKNVYWNQVAGGNWYDNAWALTSGGAVATTNFPLSQDTAIFDDTGLNASTTITAPAIDVGTIDMSALTNATTLDTAGVVALYKDFTLSSAVTLANTGGSSGGLFFAGQIANQNLTSAGRTFVQEVSVQGPGVSLVLMDTFLSTSELSLIYGTLDLNGQLVTADRFTGTGSFARTLAFNGSYLEITGSNKTVWDCNDLTNFSYTGTPDVRFTYSGSTGTRTVNNGGTTGGTEVNAVDFNITAGSDTFNTPTGAVPVVRNLNFTGFSGLSGFFGGGFIYGNLTLSAMQTVSASALLTTFAATSGTQVITTNGVSIDRPLAVDAPGATVQLADALTLGTTRVFTLTAGTLDVDGKTLTVGAISSNNSNTRAIDLGSNGIIVNNGAWNSSTGTGMTLLGTGTINMISGSAKTLQGGGLVFPYTLNQGGLGALSITGNNTFFGISNTVQPATIGFTAGSITTVNNFTVGGTLGNLITLESGTPGVQFTLVKSPSNNETVSFCSISDSNATPYGVWFAPVTQGNVDGGNNTGWNFTAAGSSGTGMMMFL